MLKMNPKTNLMKLKLCSLVLLLVSTIALAQDVKIKDNIAYVDGKEYVRVSDCGMFKEECSISNMAGKEIIFINNLTDPRKPGTYFQVVFIGLNTTIEVKKTMKPLIELLYKNNAVGEDGKLVPENVKILFEKYGNKISIKEDED